LQDEYKDRSRDCAAQRTLIHVLADSGSDRQVEEEEEY
jgi:hypothetical protein